MRSSDEQLAGIAQRVLGGWQSALGNDYTMYGMYCLQADCVAQLAGSCSHMETKATRLGM